MPVVSYLTIDGEVISETRNGVERDYLPDPLGSTVALLDNTQTKTDTFSYWPYGEERATTGSSPTPYRFVGTLGYRRETSARTYVRARHYRTDQGRWMTRDPLWPGESAFGYVGGSPVGKVDPSGKVIIDSSCDRIPYSSSLIKQRFGDACQALRDYPTCGCDCVGWGEIYDCLLKKCQSADFTIYCHTDRQCRDLCKIDAPLCGCSGTPGGSIGLCPGSLSVKHPYACDCLPSTILHEMTHSCGQKDESVPVCVEKSCRGGAPRC